MKNLPKVGLLFDKVNPWIYPHMSDGTWLTKLRNEYEIIEIWSEEKATEFDVLFILGYTKIIPKSVLAKNGINLVVHESALPEGRGFSPVQWQILEGVSDITVCLIEASEKVDEGNVLGTTRLHLEGHELFDEIRSAQAQATKILISDFLQTLPAINCRPQVGQATYYRRRNRDDDRLDPEMSLVSQFNKLRIADNKNYPSYFELFGYRYELTIRKSDKNE